MMKVKGKFDLEIVPVIEPDDMNGTTVRVNGVTAWPGSDKLTISPGDNVEIEIPSGTLSIIADSVRVGPSKYYYDDDEALYISGAGSWDGKAGGLAGGQCAIGTFSVSSDAVVVASSALADGDTMQYTLYERVRNNDLVRQLPPLIKSYVMREIFARRWTPGTIRDYCNSARFSASFSGGTAYTAHREYIGSWERVPDIPGIYNVERDKWGIVIDGTSGMDELPISRNLIAFVLDIGDRDFETPLDAIGRMRPTDLDNLTIVWALPGDDAAIRYAVSHMDRITRGEMRGGLHEYLYCRDGYCTWRHIFVVTSRSDWNAKVDAGLGAVLDITVWNRD